MRLPARAENAQTLRESVAMLRDPVVGVWAIYLLLVPVYVFASGLPQPGDTGGLRRAAPLDLPARAVETGRREIGAVIAEEQEFARGRNLLAPLPQAC
jgi:hypothetical protein